MQNNYTVYHLHSDLSNGVTNIDSVTKYDQYIEYAASLGMTAIGFAEHGSIFQFIKKKECVEKHNMKYIHASEFYVTATLDEKIRDNKHCVLIAKNYDGFQELNALSSKSFNRTDGHYYYVPRITLKELMSTSDNILITTACIGGLLYEGDIEVRKQFLGFLIKNKHRCFLEVQHHADEHQVKYNQYLLKLNQKYNIPLIAGTDTHALNEEHLEGRKILQLSKNVRFASEDSWDLTFKTYDELVEAYAKQNSLPTEVFLKAIENTNRMADLVEEYTINRDYKYPHLWDNPDELFREKIKQGIKWRGVDKYPNYQEYLDRIEYEIKAYKHNQAIDFMLLMEDIIDWCKAQDIQVGYGRGSVNGSVIAWLLGITEMDSIKHNLNFERFMNIERVSLSDIDTDFPPSRRKEVKDYIFGKTGLYCCDIITFNTIALKGAIRDVGRALQIPLSEVGEICEAVETNEEELREKYPELFRLVDIVNGTIVSVGSHPCGQVVSPHDVCSAFGTFTTSTSDYPISQINMKEIDGLNYVKLDLLALDTIELINETCKLANIERLTPDNVDTNDIDVWNSMRDDTTQIFQWEGNTGDNYIKKLLSDENIKKFQKVNENIDRMTLLSIGNSAIRPAGASYREDLANGVIRKTGCKEIDDFLSNTFGFLVFQCQIIEFLHKLCGFTMGEADIVRRGFAKKTGTDKFIPVIKYGGYLNENKKEHYIRGFIDIMTKDYGQTKDKAEKDIVAFVQVIEDASSYLFSLNHSQPYSYEGYVSAYLRYHYPVEFLTEALRINKDKEDKTLKITEYAKKNNVEISPIKFRKSQADYSCDAAERVIYKGISSIKYLNEDVANALYEVRDKQYDSFVDLLIDIKDMPINSKQLEILIKLDFFAEFGEINTLLKQNEFFGRIYGKKQFAVEKINSLEIPTNILDRLSTTKTAKTYKGFDSVEVLKAVLEQCEYPKTSIKNRLDYEVEHLGYTTITMPNADISYAYILKVDGKYSNKNITLYRLKNGEQEIVKVKGKTLADNPLSVGDIIKTIECSNERKWGRDADGNFYQKDEYETILKKYSYVR